MQRDDVPLDSLLFLSLSNVRDKNKRGFQGDLFSWWGLRGEAPLVDSASVTVTPFVLEGC